MTPGTKVRTTVSVKAAYTALIPLGTCGVVVAEIPGLKRPIEVEFPSQFAHTYFRSDELETIE